VVFDLSCVQEDYMCNIDGVKGIAGHVILEYPSGGYLLTSCGHWIELSRLDVSIESLYKIAQNSYGGNMSEQIMQEYNDASESEKSEVVQKYSRKMVQESAPCQYSSY